MQTYSVHLIKSTHKIKPTMCRTKKVERLANIAALISEMEAAEKAGAKYSINELSDKYHVTLRLGDFEGVNDAWDLETKAKAVECNRRLRVKAYYQQYLAKAKPQEVEVVMSPLMEPVDQVDTVPSEVGQLLQDMEATVQTFWGYLDDLSDQIDKLRKILNSEVI